MTTIDLLGFTEKQSYISNILGSLQNRNLLVLDPNYLIHLIHLIISNIIVEYNNSKKQSKKKFYPVTKQVQ